MITATYRIKGGDFASAGSATRSLKEQVKKLGIEAEVMRRIMISAYEAEMNVVIHAYRGNLWARLNQGRIDLEVVDEGPGIPDIEMALKEGYSTAPAEARELGFGAGMGLPNIRKASDLFEIESRVGRGTRVRSTIFLKALAASEAIRNSILVRPELCRSCLACLAACPTRAIRVWEGKPRILEHLCIDCTACIAACPCGALSMHTDAGNDAPLVVEEGAALVVPLPFLSGFPQAGPREVLRALEALGFREVRPTEDWEASLRETARGFAVQEARQRPVISPVCPAAVNLIEMHFTALVDHLAPYLSPVEAARDEFSLRPLAVVASCPAQATLLHPGSLPGRLQILSPARLAAAVALELEKRRGQAAEEPPAASAVATAPGGQEGEALRVTGASHVLRVLEKAEAGALADVLLLEPFLCDQGCWGSPLFAQDPYLSRHRAAQAGLTAVKKRPVPRRTRAYVPRSGVRLDENMAAAMRKLARIDELARSLPGRDCRICGAPSCASLAEDIVMGRYTGTGCPLEES